MKKKNSNPSQAQKILAHMKSGRSITPIEALVKFGCYRLAARICELRKTPAGRRIKQKAVTSRKTGKTFASYSIAK